MDGQAYKLAEWHVSRRTNDSIYWQKDRHTYSGKDKQNIFNIFIKKNRQVIYIEHGVWLTRRCQWQGLCSTVSTWTDKHAADALNHAFIDANS